MIISAANILINRQRAFSAAAIFVLLIGRTITPVSAAEAVADVRIMPLGDSITQGYAGHDIYRRPLWKKLKKSGAKVNFVGSMRLNYPGGKPKHIDFDMDHEGHWGWRADEVLAKLDGWTKKSKPDVVLVHLGTNDIFQDQDNAETVEELRGIIKTLRKHNPKVTVLLAQLIPANDKATNVKIRKLNKLLPGMAKSMSTEQSPIYVVNQFEGFDGRKDNYDGVHPNESGIEKMAQKWYEALRSLPELKGK